MIYNPELQKACDLVSRRCTEICDTFHGSAWLYDKLMRYFNSEPSAQSITIPVCINLVGDGTAEIGRDGSLIMRANH